MLADKKELLRQRRHEYYYRRGRALAMWKRRKARLTSQGKKHKIKSKK